MVLLSNLYTVIRQDTSADNSAIIENISVDVPFLSKSKTFTTTNENETQKQVIITKKSRRKTFYAV